MGCQVSSKYLVNNMYVRNTWLKVSERKHIRAEVRRAYFDMIMMRPWLGEPWRVRKCPVSIKQVRRQLVHDSSSVICMYTKNACVTLSPETCYGTTRTQSKFELSITLFEILEGYGWIPDEESSHGWVTFVPTTCGLLPDNLPNQNNLPSSCQIHPLRLRLHVSLLRAWLIGTLGQSRNSIQFCFPSSTATSSTRIS